MASLELEEDPMVLEDEKEEGPNPGKVHIMIQGPIFLFLVQETHTHAYALNNVLRGDTVGVHLPVSRF